MRPAWLFSVIHTCTRGSFLATNFVVSIVFPNVWKFESMTSFRFAVTKKLSYVRFLSEPAVFQRLFSSNMHTEPSSAKTRKKTCREGIQAYTQCLRSVVCHSLA